MDWWVWVLIAVVVLGIVLWLVSRSRESATDTTTTGRRRGQTVSRGNTTKGDATEGSITKSGGNRVRTRRGDTDARGDGRSTSRGGKSSELTEAEQDALDRQDQRQQGAGGTGSPGI